MVNDKELGKRLHFIQNATGGILQPFDSWLLIRGIKTLSVRLDRHIDNAKFIVEFLKNHEAIEKIYYPGLKEHEGYKIHKRQAKAAGAMISFVLKDNIDLNKFFARLELITLGESLGGVESLISHPASMTHASIPYEIRQKVGIVDKLVRLSIGIENKLDLVKDIENALRG